MISISVGSVPNVFQSTHPVRGATVPSSAQSHGLPISIHAPREGCDQGRDGSHDQGRISIHAPREGCDEISTALLLSMRHFNPRTP